MSGGPPQPSLLRSALTALRARPRLAVLGMLLLSAWTVVPLQSLRVDNGLSTWFDEDEPVLQEYRAYQQRFGHDERAVYAVPADWSAEGLATFRRATERLEALGEVRSLGNATRVQADTMGLEIAPWIRDGLTDDEARHLRDDALATPELHGRLVSRDGGRLLAVLTFGEEVDSDEVRNERLAAASAIWEEEGFRPDAAGVAVLTSTINSLSKRNTSALLLGAFGLIALLLGLALRDLRATLGALSAVALSILWTLALFALAGQTLNLVTLVLPTLLLVMGVANSVHLISHARANRDDPVGGLLEQLHPSALNTLTTALAFGSLVAAPLPALRSLGLFAAMGMVTSLAFSTAFAAVGSGQPPEPRRAARALRLSGAAMRAPRLTVALWLLFAVAAAGFASNLQVDTYALDMLAPTHPVRLASEGIERDFDGVVPMDFVLDTVADPLRPEHLRSLEAWEREVIEAKLADRATSVLTIVKRLEEVLSEEGPAGYRVPSSVERVEQGLFLYGANADVQDWYQAPQRLRVRFGLPMVSAREAKRRLEQTLALAPEGARPTGYLPVYIEKIRRIVQVQFTGLALSFTLVFALIGLWFRSARYTLLAIPSNGVPILAALGLMGALGVRVDAITVTAAPILIGLVVDDTVQLLWRYRQTTGTPGQRVEQTVSLTGRAVGLTSAILAIGFSVLLFAQIQPMAWFGLLLSGGITIAWLADLTLLPALLVMTEPEA